MKMEFIFYDEKLKESGYTKEYEKNTNKKLSEAYREIKKYMKENGFVHRQGSGYISKKSMTDKDAATIISLMSKKFKWLKCSVRGMDATNIGKQYSMVKTIEAVSQNDEFEIEKTIK